MRAGANLDAQDAMGVSAAHMAVAKLPPGAILGVLAEARAVPLASRDPRGRSAAEAYIQRLLSDPGSVNVRAACSDHVCVVGVLPLALTLAVAAGSASGTRLQPRVRSRRCLPPPNLVWWPSQPRHGRRFCLHWCSLL